MQGDDDFLALSYIAQYGYCPRRAALLMNEQLWTENKYTAEGRWQHRRTHDHRIERRSDALLLYEFPVFSAVLHLSGKCDCIEARADPQGVALPGEARLYTLYPVEYKHGPVRQEREYEQQLCAQAICLEEMYGARIPRGALFYIQSHRRLEVEFSPALRQSTTAAAGALLALWRNRVLPAPSPGPRCRKCSMREACMPKLSRTAAAYRRNLLFELQKDGAP